MEIGCVTGVALAPLRLCAPRRLRSADGGVVACTAVSPRLSVAGSWDDWLRRLAFPDAQAEVLRCVDVPGLFAVGSVVQYKFVTEDGCVIVLFFRWRCEPPLPP